jgi:EAL domain-containing protein (putative c-di-GMP-specific phosphodiesterase class I)/GGDEF domain-containing protein
MSPKNSGEGVSDYRAERDRFVAFAFAAADVVFEVGSDERIVYAAGATQAMTGRATGSLIGTLFHDLFAETHRGFVRSLSRRVRLETRMAPVIVPLERAGKPALSVVLNGCRLPEKDNRLYFTVALRLGVPSATAAAARDEETGLLDRSGFQAAAVATLTEATANGGVAGLTLLDLAGIDDLRAKSGERAVTQLLGEIGNFLNAQSVDGSNAGRLAPDRFGVVQGAGKTADLGKEIERISQAHDRTGRGLRVKEKTVALATDGLSEADAEKALVYTLGRFAAKGGDALPIRSLTDGLRELVADTVGRISHLRDAVGDKLGIVFQPVVELADARIHHYEVLSRFEDDRSPTDLIQFAEGIGMIEDLDLTVCQRVLSFLDGSRDNPLKLAVNLSGRSLRSDAFVGALERLLERRTDRQQILFEITETTEITDLQRADRIIQDLRGKGHGICLDDFGAGAASFPYLQALTIDFIKIDGAYVRRMLDAARDHTILKAMVRLCRDLGTATIAEMIETETQLGHLFDIGVRYGQGYLFGRPAATPAPIGPPGRKVPPHAKVFAKRKGVVETWG